MISSLYNYTLSKVHHTITEVSWSTQLSRNKMLVTAQSQETEQGANQVVGNNVPMRLNTETIMTETVRKKSLITP